MSELVYAIPPMVGLFLIWLGLQYQDYITGIFGGLTFFLFGVSILLNPLPSFQGVTNIILGSMCLGFGAYIMIRGSVEEIQAWS